MNPIHVFLALETLTKATELFLKLRAAAQQAGELTPEQEAELDARTAALFAQPHWQPSKE